MAINVVQIRCPACGADLSVDSTREFSFCSYCGSKVILNNDNEHVYRTIDEAGIKQAETDRIIRLREMELEEKEAAKSRKSKMIAYGIALAFVLVGALICIFQPLAGMWGIIIGAYIALFTFIKSDEKKKQPRRVISSTEAQITAPMLDYEDKNFQSIEMLFKGTGFINVTAVPMGDLNMFTQKKNGKVESVTINGSDEFDEGDVYPKDASVLITYHSKA